MRPAPFPGISVSGKPQGRPVPVGLAEGMDELPLKRSFPCSPAFTAQHKNGVSPVRDTPICMIGGWRRLIGLFLVRGAETHTHGRVFDTEYLAQ